MPEFLQNIWNQFTEFWNGLEKNQKTRIYITTAIVSVAVIVGLLILTKPEYTSLVDSSDPAQNAEIIAVLDTNNITYKLEDSGISINKKDLPRSKLILAQAGYPKSGLTFSGAMSLIGIGTTENDKEQIWQEKLKADIERSIMAHDNIQDVDVNLALPEESIFAFAGKEKERPKAHVTVKPKSRMTTAQIQSIVRLVASSVVDLDTKDVFVVDNNLNPLNADISDDSMGLISSQEEMRVTKNHELQNRIYTLFGFESDYYDNLKVVVNAVLDFDKQNSQTKSFKNPDGMDDGALISEQTKSETLENGQAGDVPGTDTNPGTTTYPSGSGENSNYKNKEETKNRVFDETISEQEKAIGNVLPDSTTAVVALWYGKRVTDETKIDTTFMQSMKTDVANALGIPVNNVSINKYKLAPEAVITRTTMETVNTLIDSYGLFALMLVLILALLIAAKPKRKDAELGEGMLAEEEMEAVPATGPRFIVPEDIEELPEIELEERSEVKKQIDKFVQQKPDAVAQLLRNWIAEEWD
jgi:flagellar M-ring protein FliF